MALTSGPLENGTNMSCFRMVQYQDAWFQLKWSIWESYKSGFRMVTVQSESHYQTSLGDRAQSVNQAVRLAWTILYYIIGH
jgi:hypothetical protein